MIRSFEQSHLLFIHLKCEGDDKWDHPNETNRVSFPQRFLFDQLDRPLIFNPCEVEVENSQYRVRHMVDN